MSLKNKNFQKAYLKMITEENEQTIIPTGVCQKCYISFTDDIAKVGEPCPNCGETIKPFNASNYSGSGEDTPPLYDSDDITTECGDITSECGKYNEYDILEEDDDFKYLPCEEDESDNELDDKFSTKDNDLSCEDDELANESDNELASECNDFACEDDKNENENEFDVEEISLNNNFDYLNDPDLIPPQNYDNIGIINEEDEDNFIDKDMDDVAADKDTENKDMDDEADDEADDEDEDTDLAESKIISFTVADPAIIELFEKVQSGELKLVAVTPDFEFSKEDKNTNPDITAEVLDNFDIENVTDDKTTKEDEEAEDDNDDDLNISSDDDAANNDEDTADEDMDKIAKNKVKVPSAKPEKVVKECKVKTPSISKVKFNKRGPY